MAERRSGTICGLERAADDHVYALITGLCPAIAQIDGPDERIPAQPHAGGGDAVRQVYIFLVSKYLAMLQGQAEVGRGVEQAGDFSLVRNPQQIEVLTTQFILHEARQFEQAAEPEIVLNRCGALEGGVIPSAEEKCV